MKICIKFALRKIRRQGTRWCPLFFIMTEIKSKIEAFVLPLLEETDVFLLQILVQPNNDIKVFLDADSGMSIDKCVKINRKLRFLVEESGMFTDGDFSLEVSSPGVDEPLTSIRQYQKNVGRTVLVTTHKEEPNDHLGILKEVLADGILLERKLVKKKETEILVIPFNEIKKIIVQIVF